MHALRRQHGWTVVVIMLCLMSAWVFLHLPGIFFETDGAMFPGFRGDEQSPVNGALHMLEDKSPLGLRNHDTLYYGPVFSLLALPAIATDYLSSLISQEVHNATEYKELLLWDWGGILWKTRLMTTLISFFGLIAFYCFLNTRTINPSGKRLLPFLGTLALSANFLFFEYAALFSHWSVIISIFFAQLYCLVKIEEKDQGSTKYWIYQAVLSIISFGISYLPMLFQVMWLPVIVRWLKKQDRTSLKKFAIYTGGLLLGAAAIVWWHPLAFLRYVGALIPGFDKNAVFFLETPELSYVFYSEWLLNVLFPLWPFWVAAIVYLLFVKKTYEQYWFWVPIITGLLYFTLFGFMSHHETRYVLPLIALFFASLFSLLVHYADHLFSFRAWRASFVIVIIFSLGYQSLGDYLIYREHYSPWPRQHQLVAELTDLQKENKEFSALVVGTDMLSAPHTKEAYVNYMEECGKRDARVYNEMIASQAPSTATPLNVYYHCRGDSPTKEKRERFTMTIYTTRTATEFGANMADVLFLRDFSYTYTAVTRTGLVEIN